MTPEESVEYIREVELRFKALSAKFDAVCNLLEKSLKEDREVKAAKDEIMLGLKKYEYLKPSLWHSIGELQGPTVETVSGLHKELFRLAKIFYKKLDAGEDPGPAKAFLDGVGALLSENDSYAAELEVREHMLRLAIAHMECERIVAGFGKDSE